MYFCNTHSEHISMKKSAVFIFVFLSSISLFAQYKYRSPLDIPLVLSANFGELRPNHFHSGIDLKTQSVINKPVYAIEDGYISRISVSPSGYGLALYINHPKSGHMSVYGHLNSFAPKTAEYAKNKQYERESFAVDISVPVNALPVKKGDLIAYSGNTGSSGGPHVHFEIRDSKTQLVLDPLPYYKEDIKDTQAPIVKGITVYPLESKGVVNNSPLPLRQAITQLKEGGHSSLKDTIQAWGMVGIGINANDMMDETTNIYGVKSVRLYCDDKPLFSYNISTISFDKTRMINSLIDFDYWSQKKVFYMKSIIEPGNKLPMISAANNGYMDINQERVYNFRYELEDLYGNSTIYAFEIEGKKQPIPEQPQCSQAMAWNQNNYFITETFSLTIPKANLYKDICFSLQQDASKTYLSDVYTVHKSFVPLQGNCEMKISLNKDTVPNKSHYGIVRIRDGKESWVGGTYKSGALTTNIRELGNTYAISTDTEAPVITPLSPAKWVANKLIRIKVTDNKSGVKSYRGTINGKYALFEHDSKSTIYSYKFDAQRLQKGQKNTLVFTVVDDCGNKASYKYEFTY